MMYCHNVEGRKEYNIHPTQGRKPGLSAMMRLGNEEEFIGPCIESIIDWFDEIVCTLQCTTDSTEDVLRSFGSKKIIIHHYPFESRPNGPGHDEQQRGSVHERAYFYNWSLALTSHQWVSKWDGDMVAHDALGSSVRQLIDDGHYTVVCCAGTNIVGDMRHVSINKAATANEPRFFRVTSDTHYFTAKFCEDLCHPDFRRGQGFDNGQDKTPGDKVFRMPTHGYLHFKWAKSQESAMKAWPQDWRDTDHFRSIIKQNQPGKRYKGPVPRSLRGVMC